MNYCIVMKYSAKENCYMADGNTPNEAYENIKIVMEEYIETAHMEGRKIPEPSFGNEL